MEPSGKDGKDPDLKKCPFCGGFGALNTSNATFTYARAFVFCRACAAKGEAANVEFMGKRISDAWDLAKQAAANYWNRRVEP